MRRIAIGAAGAMLLAALLVPRLASLRQSLWADEIGSIDDYIKGGPSAIFGHYGTNDHMLFSLASWATVRLPGAPDWGYRLWGIVPFLAAVALFAWWLRWRAGYIAARFFVCFAAANGLLLQLTAEARGYGLAFLMMTTLIVAGCELESGRKWIVAFMAAAVLGVWTLPTFILPASAATVLALIRHRRLRRRLAVGTVIGVALTIAWYAPDAAGLFDATGQHFGHPLHWWSAFTGPFELLPISILPGTSFGSATSLVLGAIAAPLILAGAREAVDAAPGLASLSAAVSFTTFAVLAVSRFFADPRFLSYLLAPVIALVSLGSARMLRAEGRVRWVLARQYVGGLLASTTAFFALVGYGATTMPWEDIRGAAAAIEAADPDGTIPVLTDVHIPRDYRYYLPSSIRLYTGDDVTMQEMICAQHPHGLIFVEQPYRVARPNTSCLRAHDATLHRFEQQSRGARIDVWVIPPSI